MTTLKVCPFCGGYVEYWHDITGEPVGVTCPKCRIVVRMLSIGHHRTFGAAMENIAMRWNKREGKIWRI